MTTVRSFDSDARDAGLIVRLRALAEFPQLIWQNRNMVANFFQRELMGRFHGSLLGAWWMLVQPLFMFAVYYVIFGKLYGRGDGDPVEFALYMFSGVVCFHALNEALSNCCTIVVSNGNLVKKVAFPSEVLPIPSALVSIVLFAVGAVVVVAVGVTTGKFTPGIELLCLPIVILLQLALTLGIGLLLANANVFIRDVQQVWRIFSMAWFFLSPVFWHPRMMAELIGDPALTQLAFYANPAYSLLMAHRIALGGEIPALGITDIWWHISVLATWAFTTLVLGHLTFTANKHKHADLV
ncbi:MAG: hypothetical protein CMJ88_07005 [Planctomycetes bacterium]|nr:hypothetical protein [Planctomycetota bacterium]